MKNYLWNTSSKLLIGYIIFLMMLVACGSANAQSPCNDDVCVVQFNASWNAAKSVDWLEKLSDCSIQQIDIASDTKAAAKYKIVVVPTIVIYKGGEEVDRYQANIMMEMEATKKQVQGSIDEILMEDF
tara:strand:- start:802 stop:1185 length:384 start_codon:yes stop_codon:yes gene_type:complete